MALANRNTAEFNNCINRKNQVLNWDKMELLYLNR